METTLHYVSVQVLNLILEKLNKIKIIRNPNKPINVDKIISANIRNCSYVGKNSIEIIEIKTHLNVKFYSPDEPGLICISVLLDNFNDLFP